ncbi:MAG TPA: hypothetical protein VF589_11560 [Allosphingosinicella sp.]|jgi:hypothetical protein
MWLGTPSSLQYVVAPDEEAISLETEGANMASVRPIAIGREMRVTLLPHWNFELLSPNGEKKPLGLDESATWQWQVRPKEQGGPFEILAEVQVFGPDRDGKATVLDTYTRRVAVQVHVGTWNGFLNALAKAKTLGELFQALFATWKSTLISLSALLAALGGVIVAVRTLGSKKGQETREQTPAPD